MSLLAKPTSSHTHETPNPQRTAVITPPAIISLVAASDADQTDSVYGNADTITITFDKATDLAGLAVGAQQPRTVVDTLFDATQALGSDYRGTWVSNKVFRITIVDWPGAAPPEVGPEGLQVQVISNLGRAIRADPSLGLSVSSNSLSPRLTGDFGPSNININSITASPPASSPGLDTYRDGSKITIVFSRDTNQGFETLDGDTTLTKAQVRDTP